MTSIKDRVDAFNAAMDYTANHTQPRKSLLIEATFALDRFRVHKYRNWGGGMHDVLVNDLPSLEAAKAWCAEHHPDCYVIVEKVVARKLEGRP
jgi:hypothetical protein